MAWANVIVWVVGVYAAIGVVCGGAFVVRGVGRVDVAAKDAPIGFRLVVFPGAAALWPWVLVRWLRAPKAMPEAVPGNRGHA